jgi:hypothetical protein|tara:strand:+ start:3100 stop:3504 length:405 start_codon:yes stop_codon:yes gene_type:complete
MPLKGILDILGLDFRVKSQYNIKTLGTQMASGNIKGESMKRFNPKTKTFKVFNALYNGEALTSSKAKKMGVGNLGAEVSRIKQNGYAVYTNSRKAGNGVRVTEYVMGKPSREIVALGYAAKSKGLTLDTITSIQ